MLFGYGAETNQQGIKNALDVSTLTKMDLGVPISQMTSLFMCEGCAGQLQERLFYMPVEIILNIQQERLYLERLKGKGMRMDLDTFAKSVLPKEEICRRVLNSHRFTLPNFKVT